MTASDRPAPASHWTAPTPAPRSRARRLLALLLFLAGIAFVGYVGLAFLGRQVGSILAGKVLFGATPPAAGMCAPTPNASTLTASGEIYWGAYLREDVPAGTSLTVRVLLDDEMVGERPFEVTAHGADCLSSTASLGPLEPGTLTIRVLRGDAVEAEGTIRLQ